MSDNPTNTDEAAQPGQQSELQRAVALGFDMEKFKQGPIGRYFAARARDNILDDTQLLTAVDIFAPDGPAKFARLQQRIRVAEQFFIWMRDAIESGRDAAAQIQTAESEPVDPIG